jgi:hypothetical protein
MDEGNQHQDTLSGGGLWASLDVITSHLLELALSLVSGLLEVITGP